MTDLDIVIDFLDRELENRSRAGEPNSEYYIDAQLALIAARRLEQE